MSLLAAVLPFEEGSTLSYRHLSSSSPDAYANIEAARRRFLPSAQTGSLLSHVLTVAHISTTSSLYVFKLGSNVDTIPDVYLDDLAVETLATGSCDPMSLPHSLWNYFLSAVRIAYIDKLASSHSVQRLSDGFVLCDDGSNGEWYFTSPKERPLVCVHLILYLQTTRILIHPILIDTKLYPIRLPIPQGQPLTLLPYATPAYYLSNYSGTVTVLNQQFRQVFAGLGIQLPQQVSYIVVWVLTEESEDGQDKGLVCIYPSCLALSASAYRITLNNIPELPPQLQLSPSTQQQAVKLTKEVSSTSSTSPRSALQGLKALTLSWTRSPAQIAYEVASYVDSVAKDRDRERERMKRERMGTDSGPQALLSDLPPVPQVPQLQNVYPSPPQIEGHTPMDVQYSPSVNGVTISQDHSSGIPPAASSSDTFGNDWDMLDGGNADLFAMNSRLFARDNPPSGTTHDATVTSTHSSQPTMHRVEQEPLYNEQPDSSAYAYTDPNPPSYNGSFDFNLGLDSNYGDQGFTDDDFSFFDQPSHVPPVPSITMFSGVPTDLASPPLATPSLSMFQQATPNYAEHDSHLMSPVNPLRTPDIGPLSPTSPVTIPPPTPGIYLDFPATGKERFGAVAFASQHKSSDKKYSLSGGKFSTSLPSPPPEEQPMENRPLPTPEVMTATKSSKLKSYYNHFTDPSVMLIRRLSGLKRKRVDSTDLSSSRPELKHHRADTWAGSSPDNELGLSLNMSSLSLSSFASTASFSSSGSASKIALSSDALPAATEREHTPLPSYLPPGPLLVPTHFAHSILLPISDTPHFSRSSGSTAAQLAYRAVPTPVSPSALSSRLSGMQAAADFLGREIVDSGLWIAGPTTSLKSVRYDGQRVWPSDIAKVAAMLPSVEGTLQDHLDTNIIFGVDTSTALEQLSPPRIVMAKGESIIELNPPALRFWDKLGLSPRGGSKDAESWVIYQEYEGTGKIKEQNMKHSTATPSRAALAQRWLSSTQKTYQACNMGHLTSGAAHDYPDGLLPVSFDSGFRKHLSTFIGQRVEERSRGDIMVFFVVLPLRLGSLTSQLFRQTLLALRKVCSSTAAPELPQIIIHCVPELAVFGVDPPLPASDAKAKALCRAVYDRILAPVDRTLSLRCSRPDQPDTRYFQHVSFALARSQRAPEDVLFVYRAPHTVSLDATERDTLLHVGYGVSECGKWGIVACVDEHGQAYDTGVWLLDEEDDEDSKDEGFESVLVTKVWEFALRFARNADVEWRIVLARLGELPVSEVDAWRHTLRDAFTDAAPVQVSLVCVEEATPWTFTDGLVDSAFRRSAETISDSSIPGTAFQQGFMDDKHVAYAMHCIPSHISALPAAPTSDALGFAQHSVRQDPPLSMPLGSPVASTAVLKFPRDKTPHLASRMMWIHLVPHDGTTTWEELPPDAQKQAMRDVTKSFHDLAVLANARNPDPYADSLLPFHLAAVQTMLDGLALDTLLVQDSGDS